MKFVTSILNAIGNGFKFIGDLIYNIFKFIFSLVDGIFYFIAQLFQLVIEIIKVIVAIFQFFTAIVTGFIKTIGNMLTINTSKTPLNYPSDTLEGINTVKEFLGSDLLNVVPLILIAIVWLVFAKKIIGLIGGSGNEGAD